MRLVFWTVTFFITKISSDRKSETAGLGVKYHYLCTKHSIMSDKHIRFDWAIKRLLRQKANFGILEGFVSELLGFDITIQSIGESEGNKDDADDKYNRVDILAETVSKELILVEVQNEKKHNYFHRMNYGQAKLITDYMHEGDDYENVRKVYSINIVYFELGQGDDYIYKGRVDFFGLHRPDDQLQLSAVQKSIYHKQHTADLFATYYIIKTNKFDDIARDSLDQWIYFLKNNEFPAEVSAKGLKLAQERLRTDNLSSPDKEAYAQYMKDIRDRESEIATAFFDGQDLVRAESMKLISEALALAEKERAEKEKALQRESDALQRESDALADKEKNRTALINTVIEFTVLGIDVDKIASITGLTIDEIRAIRS